MGELESSPSSLDPGDQASASLRSNAAPGEETSWEEVVQRLAARSPRESRYRLEGEIGRGGMGAVLRVWDEALHRRLAMKVALGKADPPPGGGATPAVDPRTLSRFLEEAQVTGQLDHPGIVPVHELGVDSRGRVYFTMKLVKGQTLKEVFEELARGSADWTQARVLGVLLRVCEAMSYAHDKGVIHRDLKPSNVMIGRFGEVHVMDWGLAKVLGHDEQRDLRIRPHAPVSTELHSARRELTEETPDSPLVTMDGDVVGTPAYMSPEQALGRVEAIGPHSDVYAMGAMLYHLLAGRMPYVPPAAKLNNYAIWYRLQEGPPRPLHEIAARAPLELVAICEKAMARDPATRYRDMSELAADLAAFLEGRVVHAYEAGPLPELRKWVARNRWLASACAAGILVLVAGLITSSTFYMRAADKAAESQENARIAGENERRALDGEALAKVEKQRAESSERAATRHLDDVLRLSALQNLDDLSARADRLWPAHPENIERYLSWLGDAEELVAELPGHEAKLAELRARAVPWTAEQEAEARANHPRLAELESAQRHLDYLRRLVATLTASEPPREPTGREAGVDLASLPALPSEVQALARELVDPDRAQWGGEERGLVLARRAVELAAGLPAPERAAIRETLAWALFANGRLDEAVLEGEQALEEAGAADRPAFEGYLKELRGAIEDQLSPEGIEREEQLVAELEQRIASLEAEVSERPEWSFPDSQDKWWHNQLTKLAAGLEAFSDPDEGLASSGISPEHGWAVRKRLEFARTIEERSISGPEPAAKWSEALASIRDPVRCPLYEGLEMTPQLGLVPLGPDRDSGLWEFGHLQTGEPAVRGPDGKLVLTEDTGLVFVLLPGGRFQVGSQSQDAHGPNYDPLATGHEGPVHAVRLSPFFLSKYEMTQGQWQRFTGRNPSVYTPAGLFHVVERPAAPRRSAAPGGAGELEHLHEDLRPPGARAAERGTVGVRRAGGDGDTVVVGSHCGPLVRRGEPV